MNSSQIYIAIAIITLLIIVVLLFVVGKSGKGRPLSPLAGVAFAFILAGILFSTNRLVGYGLMGVGVVLAVVDIIRKARNK